MCEEKQMYRSFVIAYTIYLPDFNIDMSTFDFLFKDCYKGIFCTEDRRAARVSAILLKIPENCRL